MRIMVRFIAAGLLLALSACGGGDDDASGGTPPPPPQIGIGAAGGTVTGPNGSKVVIPAGALTVNTPIAIEQTSAGSPPLPSGLAVGQMFALTPHGTVFALPVTLTLPFDSASVPIGAVPALFKTNAQNQFDLVANATFDASTVTAEITSFSSAQIVIPPLVRNDPTRDWEFNVFPGDGGIDVQLDADRLVGGQLEEIGIFGNAVFDDVIIGTSESQQADGIANGFVFSSPSGATYGVSAEAPFNRLGGSDPIGSKTRLRQTQSFVKRAADASLRFTVTAVAISVSDFNPSLGTGPAPLKGEVLLAVQAYKTPTDNPFFYTAGRASVFGANGSGGNSFLFFRAEDESFSRTHLWSATDFDFDTRAASYSSSVSPPVIVGPDEANCLGSTATLLLKKPLTYTVDLAAIRIDEEFTLRIDTFAETNNRRGGGSIGDCQASSVSAYLRDPLSVDGATLAFSGLEPTNNPLPPPPDQVLIEPASCVPGPGPNPQSGLLQFDAASYTIDEFAGSVPTIAVTRTGGSSGAVTATFTTADGTAVADIDYTGLNATVFFADGDTGQRVISVPILPDQVDEVDKTVNLALSQPGGCAALGPQTTAVLTIRDDDRLPPAGSVGLDKTFGSEGKASTTAFGGDRSAMALQADGKIVIVGGTFTDFVLARFNADGGPDASFDADGKVTTDMVSNEQEEALGVAIQGDGKIVVVGYTGTPGPGGPASFALARYNTNGSLDASFGSGGKIVSGVLGNAHAVAIQPNGKIVVAGDVPISSGADFANFALARYDTNGTLDASFGSAGQLVTDIGGGTNTARNIVLQANGAIVVSGEPIGTFTGSDHTDVVRYNLNGSLDPSFGVGGKLTLNGARVGEGLALQGDGKFVLVGNVDASIPPAIPGTVTEFAVRRLNANGSPDGAFGSAGAASTTISGQRDSARAVALQSDGKILVAGQSSNINENFAVARFNANGTLDAGFGGNGGGKLTIDFFGSTDIAESVAVQPDGKIVLGGLARDNVDGYGMARVLP
jgi:uncharacterized delta-60 repeat protein